MTAERCCDRNPTFNYSALAAREALEAGFGFTHRAAHAHDLVDPGLQRGRQREVVDRRRDQQLIGGEELVDVAIQEIGE